MKSIRAPIKMHGGKWYLREWLISKFPHDYTNLCYIEAYGGGGNVLLNKLKSVYECYNDLDDGLFNLFYYLKTEPDAFQEAIDPIEYNEEVFEAAKTSTVTGLLGAVREVILRRMSRGGLQKHFSWSKRLRGGRPGDQNAWDTFKKVHLPRICERLKDVEICNQNAINLLAEKDGPSVLWYIDPPYLPSTRSAHAVYNKEMTEQDHIDLATALNMVKGKVVLSGYYSPLYARLYKRWNMDAKNMANHSSQAKEKERRLECLWTNF